MARDAAGRFVLDQMPGPGGPYRLVAFEEDGSVRIGVTGHAEELLTSIELHRASKGYEPYAWRERGWPVAFGGVPAAAAYAEIRNEDGDAFPARIVPLPWELGTEDRAAWGAIDRFEDECTLVAFDGDGRRLTTIGEYTVAPRTAIGHGDDPIGGHWRLWIAHRDVGPMLEARYAWGGGGSGIGELPGDGFGAGSRTHQTFPEPKRWEVSGLVSSLAKRVEVATAAGPRSATVLPVPTSEFGPCNAYVAFLAGDEEPRSLTAFDATGEVLATFDYEELGSEDR